MKLIEFTCPSCGSNLRRLNDFYFECNSCGKILALEVNNLDPNERIFDNFNDLFKKCYVLIKELKKKNIYVLEQDYNSGDPRTKYIEIEYPGKIEGRFYGCHRTTILGGVIKNSNERPLTNEEKELISKYKDIVKSTKKYGKNLIKYAEKLDDEKDNLLFNKDELFDLEEELGDIYTDAIKKFNSKYTEYDFTGLKLVNEDGDFYSNVEDEVRRLVSLMDKTISYMNMYYGNISEDERKELIKANRNAIDKIKNEFKIEIKDKYTKFEHRKNVDLKNRLDNKKATELADNYLETVKPITDIYREVSYRPIPERKIEKKSLKLFNFNRNKKKKF